MSIFRLLHLHKTHGNSLNIDLIFSYSITSGLSNSASPIVSASSKSPTNVSNVMTTLKQFDNRVSSKRTCSELNEIFDLTSGAVKKRFVRIFVCVELFQNVRFDISGGRLSLLIRKPYLPMCNKAPPHSHLLKKQRAKVSGGMLLSWHLSVHLGNG